jgi:hypothetical protein
LALPLLFFWRLWSPNPADRLVFEPGDFTNQVYPYRVFVAREWAGLRLPLWNPYIYSGTPAWADIQMAPLYPFRFLLAPLALGGDIPASVVYAETVAHYALAGILTYAFGLRMLGSRSGALVAALTFTYGGYLTAYPALQTAILETAVWLPLLLLALDISLERASRSFWAGARWTVAAAAVAAVMVLAGHPQTALFCAWLAVGFTLVRAAQQGVSGSRAMVMCAMWGVVTLGLSAAQWLPTWELSRLAGRDFGPAELGAGFAPRELVQVVLPGVISRWSPLYIGAPGLALAVYGVVGGRERLRWLWVAVAVVSVVWGLGSNGPLYPLAAATLPGASVFRHQERIAVLASLSGAMLAGLGCATLMAGRQSATRRARQILAALSLAGLVTTFIIEVGLRPGADEIARDAMRDWSNAAALSMLFSGLALVVIHYWSQRALSRDAALILLVGVVVLDLFSINGDKVLAARQGQVDARPMLEAIRSEQAWPFRLSSEGLLPEGPNAGVLHRLEDVTGDSPLQLAAYRQFLELVPEQTWWRLLNVRYVLTRRELDHPSVRLLREDGDLKLYRVGLGMAPAWAVGSWRAADSREQALYSVAGSDRDIHAQAVVEGLPPSPPARGGPHDTPSRSRVSVVTWSPQFVELVADLERPSLLVLSLPYAPGWRATAARPLKVHRAYGVLQAVLLPAGSSRVRWVYRPASVQTGGLTSLAFAIGAVVVLFASIAKRRATPDVTSNVRPQSRHAGN